MAASVHNRHFPTANHSYSLPYLFTPTPTAAEREDEPPEDLEDDDGEEELDYGFDLGALKTAEKKVTALDPRDAGTADAWIPRHPSMIRLTGKHPFNSEPPVDLLMRHGFLTPSPIHYVRNHGPVPRAAWPSWAIEVSGLVRRPASITMDELVSSFAPLELPVTLVCAGNRRKEQNQVKQSVGFNWGPGGISTALWRGARLCDILERCGVRGGRRRGLHVWFEGEENLPGGGGGGSKYGTSVGLEVAMDPAMDVMVAYMMNGEVLPPDHGFPVRLIIPGYIGGRMVKWLRKIVVAEVESQNHYHFKDNRVLPSFLDAEAADAGGWWYKQEYIINELNINSVITTPCHDEVLPINSVCTQKPYTIKGYAYSGGGRKVTRVEVTLDGGETWLLCDLDHPERPTRHGKYWCWCFWSVDVEVLALLGAKEVAVRAWDESLNTQPEKLIWNVMGMMNNCWFRVKTNVCRQQSGEIGLVFEHPTQPGNQFGGWMSRQKHADSSSENQALRKISSTPVMTTTTSTYTVADVTKHSSPSSPWIIIHNNVYDCTTFLKDHPGGADSILINAGTDCTEEFDAIHSDKAKTMLDKYRIGELATTTVATPATITESDKKASVAASALTTNPREKVQCKLIRKTPVSHDVIRFRFALPSKDQSLGLPVGKHIYLCATIDGKLCMRAYTPTTLVDDEVGHFDLVVKIYERGLMTRHLSSLPVDSTIDIKGPVGHIEYAGRGRFLVRGEPKSAKRLTMIAGGTGITPIFQVMQSVLRDDGDGTEMHLVYANRTEDDILLREELDGWAEKWPERVKVWYVVGEVKGEVGWKYSVGLVTEEVLREHVPAWSPAGEVLALACGPPPMIQYAVVPGLEKLGYDVKESLIVF